MFSQQDFLTFLGHTQSEDILFSTQLKDEVIYQVHALLGLNLLKEEEFTRLSPDEMKKLFYKITLFICNSEDEFELFWESLISGDLVCVINGKESKISKPFDSFLNYKNLLQALYFFEIKKKYGKNKLH